MCCHNWRKPKKDSKGQRGQANNNIWQALNKIFGGIRGNASCVPNKQAPTHLLSQDRKMRAQCNILIPCCADWARFWHVTWFLILIFHILWRQLAKINVAAWSCLVHKMCHVPNATKYFVKHLSYIITCLSLLSLGVFFRLWQHILNFLTTLLSLYPLLATDHLLAHCFCELNSKPIASKKNW